MKDEDKAKEQLLSELAEMRQRVAQFEASEVERVQTEKSPLLLDESYQRLFEFFPIGITVLDMKGVILYCNAAVYNKGSYSKDDLVGKHFSKIAPLRARDIPNFVRIFASLIGGKVPKPFAVSYQQKGGTTGWTEVSVGLIKIGEERRILVAQNDITKRKRAEEKEKQLQQELILSSRLASIGEMASGIAHEINNPLTAVIGFAHLLMERKDVPDDIRKALEIIDSGSVRVADIVRRLLTFARQDRTEREYVNINEIIENTLALRAYAMKTGNIEARTYLDPDLPRTMAAGGQLQQVFLNIIINAETEMKRAHGKGSLLIKTEVAGEAIRVSFKDDGPGIAPEDMDRIFEPFFTTKGSSGGTGLGLSICHGIIAEHWGHLYVRSELGQGATFIVELPVVAVEKEVELAEAAVEEGEKVTGAKILVVDDEPRVRELLSQVLTDEGHNVETVDNATEALERIKGERYSLILLDIKLPGMSGIELYKNIKRIARTLGRRVVFITGDVIAPDTRDFFTRTRVPYITKPFGIKQLKESINHVLERGQATNAGS